jgi:photosystem II stability/assembly factor-like uncharacterized protein
MVLRKPPAHALRSRLEDLEARCLPNGSHWIPLNAGTSQALYRVSSTGLNSGALLYAAGAGGTVLRSLDHGATWTTYPTGTTATLHDVQVLGSFVLAVGAGGVILRSTDEGQTWAPLNSGTTADLHGVSYGDPNNVYAVGANGTILRSPDFGQTWLRQNSGTTATLYQVSGFSNGTFVVGANGTILRAPPSGQTWARQNSGTTADLLDVFADLRSADGQFAVGANGTILHSTDGGQTWTAQNSGTTATLTGVSATVADVPRVFVVGAGGTILTSADHGAAWTAQDSGTTVNLNAVLTSFSGDDAYAVGDNGTVRRFLGVHRMVVGADVGGAPQVRVFDALTGEVLNDFAAYDPAFRGGVRVATGDVNGDGVRDIITAPGRSGGPHIRVFDGRTGTLIREFMAYDPAFTGGVFVSFAVEFPFRGAPIPMVITGAGDGGGPHVQVFHAQTGELLQSFMAYDPAFRGGVRVAALHGSDPPQVVTAPGPGGPPLVRIFERATAALVGEFLAYDAGFAGGVYVAGGNTFFPVTSTSPRVPTIVTGAGAGGGPHVKVFDARTGAVLQSFFAYDPNYLGGVRVGSLEDITGNLQAEIITGPSQGGGPHVRLIDSQTLARAGDFFAFDPSFLGGVFVGPA